MLVAEIKEWDGFQCLRCTSPDPNDILIKQKDMPVKFSCAAMCAAVTTESDIGYDGCQFTQRITMQCRKLFTP
jgi:hypothetical protein